ncbi:MAG: hypothetical protein LWX56_10695 [Ignavibacteria bacterium]|nr:hypothetical protein [Ignavibacteria bacterium]
MGLGFVFTLIIAKKFGAAFLGDFSIALVIFNFTSILAVLGLDIAIVSFRGNAGNSADNDESERVFFYSLTLVIFAAIVLAGCFYFILPPLFVSFFAKNTYLREYYQVLLWALIPLAGLRICANYYRRQHKVVQFSIRNYALANMFAVPILWVMQSWKFHDLAIPYSLVFGFYFAFIVGFPYSLVFRKHRSSAVIEFPIRKLVSHSLPLMSVQLIENSFEWLAVLLTGIYLTNENTGVFALVIKIIGVLSFIDTSVNAIILPRMAEESRQRGTAALKSTFAISVRIIFYCNLAVIIGASLIIPFLLKFLGTQFIAGVYPLYIILLAKLVESFAAPYYSLLPVVNKQRALMLFYLSKAALLTLFLYICTPVWGIIGSAIAMLISTIIYVLLIRWYMSGFWHNSLNE